MTGSDSDGLLSRTRRGAVKPDVNPIEQQREALFGDNAKPFQGTLDELSRTKRRQKQRARELLFGAEPDLPCEDENEYIPPAQDDDDGPRVWVGFENWEGFDENTGRSPSESSDEDEPVSDAVLGNSGIVSETPHIVTQTDYAAEYEHTSGSMIADAKRLISIEEIEDLIAVRKSSRNSGTIEVEPLNLECAYNAEFELEPLETALSDTSAHLGEHADNPMLTHRWTLDELWAFALKLDTFEKQLVKPASLPESPSVGAAGEFTPTAQPQTKSDSAIRLVLDIKAPTAFEAPMPPNPAADRVAAKPAPEKSKAPETESHRAQDGYGAFPTEPEHLASEDELPKGRTVEETFTVAMELVERDAIAPKERKNWLLRVVLALIVVGSLALLGLGIHRAVVVSPEPAGIFREPEFMRD